MIFWLECVCFCYFQAFPTCCLLTNSDCWRRWSRSTLIRMSTWLRSRLHHLRAQFTAPRSVENSSGSLIPHCETGFCLLKMPALVESWFYICYKFSVNWILQVCLAIRQWNLVSYMAFQLSFKVQSCVTTVLQLLNCFRQTYFNISVKHRSKGVRKTAEIWKVFFTGF